MKPTNRRIVLVLWLLLTNCLPSTAAIFYDDFERDLSSWTGDTAAFVTTDGMLRSSSSKSNSTFSISRAYNGQKSMMWELGIKLSFATSSANFVDWVLHSKRSEIDEDFSGYFIRIGDKDDHIALYHRLGSEIKLLAQSKSGITHHFSGRIHCAYYNNRWTVRILDDKANVVRKLSVTDSADMNQTTSHAGLVVHQSSTSFHKKHYFDDFLVDAFVADSLGPKVTAIQVRDSTHVRLDFDEPIHISILKVRVNSAQAVAEILTTSHSLEMQLARPLLPGANTLILVGVHDIFLNPADSVFQLIYTPPKLPEPFGLLVTEIMMDPSPSIGLREVEYIELFNASGDTINLEYIRLNVNTKQVRLPTYWLPPAAYVVVSEELVYSGINSSPTVVLDYLPPLTNGVGRIQLTTYSGEQLFEVNYSSEQHTEPWKKAGGWSLEMMDVSQPCVLQNWASSNNVLGGSPGLPNTGHQDVLDLTPPHVVGVVVQKYRVGFAWNEALIAYQPSTHDLRVNPKVDIAEIHLEHDTLWVFLNESLRRNQVYQFYLSNIHDCSGNFLDTMVRGTRSTSIPVNDIVISEVLFDSDGLVDEFVEITNLSEQVINTSQLVLERLEKGTRYGYCTLPNGVLAPKESIVLTRAITERLLDLVGGHRHLMVTVALPALPNDGVELRLSTITGQALDMIKVQSSYHNPWISNLKNVSLERISLAKSGLDSSNWTSASGPKFSSPTHTNSYQRTPKAIGRLHLSADPLTPNGDGYHDYVQIKVEGQVNSVADVAICDLRGRHFAQMLKDVPVSSSVTVNWYATDDNGRAVPEGIYVVVLRMLIDGRQHIEKLPLTVSYTSGF